MIIRALLLLWREDGWRRHRSCLGHKVCFEVVFVEVRGSSNTCFELWLNLLPLGFSNGTRPRRGSSSGSGSNSSEETNTPRRRDTNKDSSDILFDPTYLPSGAPRASNVDQLDYIANHRRSHVAEEGKLIPRSRLTNQRGNTTSDAPLDRGFSSRLNGSAEDSSDPFATPVGTPMAVTRSAYIEEPPSFVDFVNSSPSTNSRIEALDDAQPTSPNLQNDINALHQADGNRQHRQSQSARKVNSGFEILGPGGLSRSAEYAADWNEKAGNGNKHQAGKGAEIPGSKRHSKKLQRKRADSKESRFKEEV